MSPHPRAEAWSSAEKGLMLSSVVLITLSAFESLATTTIMPNVVASFHADSWFAVSSGAALITNLIANVLAGGLSDALGVKKVFAWGLGLFCVGLLVSTFAPHIAVFVLGRLIQGLGGGFIIVPLYVLVGAIATPPASSTLLCGFLPVVGLSFPRRTCPCRTDRDAYRMESGFWGSSSLRSIRRDPTSFSS